MSECKITNAYGIHFACDDIKQVMKFYYETLPNAEHAEEVHIGIDGVVKVFTFADFLERLGYTAEDLNK